MGKEITTILTPRQKNLLSLISREPSFRGHFYLSGGTALAEFYLHHRLSEDLDFFSEEEFDPQPIFVFFKKIQKEVGMEKVDFEQSFNRNLFFLHFNDEVIKTEFTFYPFPRIDSTAHRGTLIIDSLLDIAVNKLFTIYQKPRARDFIDLYFIVKQEGWNITELVKKAKIKFDWHVDPVQLGAQFMQAKIVKDYPRMLKKIEPGVWQGFFEGEAKKLGESILE